MVIVYMWCSRDSGRREIRKLNGIFNGGPVTASTFDILIFLYFPF